VIPDKEALIEAREGAEAQQRAQEQQLMQQLMGEKLNALMPYLPKDTVNNLRMFARNDPAAFEQQVRQIVAQTPLPQNQARPYADNVQEVV